jgi:hypothetical protein
MRYGENKMTKKSFDKWYNNKYGAYPSEKSIEDVLITLAVSREKFRNAEDEFEMVIMWTKQKEAAWAVKEFLERSK